MTSFHRATEMESNHVLAVSFYLASGFPSCREISYTSTYTWYGSKLDIRKWICFNFNHTKSPTLKTVGLFWFYTKVDPFSRISIYDVSKLWYPDGFERNWQMNIHPPKYGIHWFWLNSHFWCVSKWRIPQDPIPQALWLPYPRIFHVSLALSIKIVKLIEDFTPTNLPRLSFKSFRIAESL